MGSLEDTKPTWQELAARKRAAQDALIPSHLRLKSLPPPSMLDVTSIPRTCGLLSERDLEITETANVGILLNNMARGVWTATEVTRAYCNRALVAQQLIHCLTEIFVDKAMERAKELDAYSAKEGRTVGPLHGLPISLKDQVDIEGIELTLGYVGNIGKISPKNSVLADILLAQGAVLYVRTNLPQSIMFGEGHNNVFDRTLNPFNVNLTCGGSSSGEGALVGILGSPLGVGSDLGGSIRIPAAFQGLYGLRPSYNRIPYTGSTNSLEGQEAVPSVLGPLSCSVDGLKTFVKAIVDGKPWLKDPVALRMPWDETEYHLASHGGEGGKLTFAIMGDDGYVKPMPPYARALQETKDALLAAGHEVIDWVPYKSAEAFQILLEIFAADGGKDINTACALSGEPRIGWTADQSADALLKHVTTYDFWQLCRRKLAWAKGHLDHWEATASKTQSGRPVDAIIAPVGANCPQPHGKSSPNTPWRYIGYTGFGNLADYASSAFPVTRVDPKIDLKASPHDFRCPADEAIYKLYEPEVFVGAPIGLQLIGKKNEDEAVIRMTEIVDAALKLHRSE